MNVLFIAEGQLGDLLLLTPAIRAVKETFPHSRVSVLVLERRTITPLKDTSAQEPFIQTGRGSGPLATNPNVDTVVTIDRNALRSFKGLERIRNEFDVVRFLRSKRFDAVVCTFPEDRFALWAFASGASLRIGQHNQPFRFLLTHTPKIEKSEAGVLEYYCSLVKAIGANVRSPATEYVVPDEARRWCDQYLRSNNVTGKLVAVHPGATGDYKIWPPERFASVIDTLQVESRVKVILCHSQYDVPVVKEIMANLKSKILVHDTGDDLAKLAAILQKCSLCFTNDSGPRHLAAAVGTPSLAVFRQHHDREWKAYPESSLHSTLKSMSTCQVCPAGVCLDRIPAEEHFSSHCLRMVTIKYVVDKARRMLSGE